MSSTPLEDRFSFLEKRSKIVSNTSTEWNNKQALFKNRKITSHQNYNKLWTLLTL